MVELRTLNPPILVRIQVPMPYRRHGRIRNASACKADYGGALPPDASKFAHVAQRTERVSSKDRVGSSILPVGADLAS